MSTEIYLFLANGIVWLGMGLYLALLGSTTARLNRRLARMEALEGGDA